MVSSEAPEPDMRGFCALGVPFPFVGGLEADVRTLGEPGGFLEDGGVPRTLGDAVIFDFAFGAGLDLDVGLDFGEGETRLICGDPLVLVLNPFTFEFGEGNDSERTRERARGVIGTIPGPLKLDGVGGGGDFSFVGDDVSESVPLELGWMEEDDLREGEGDSNIVTGLALRVDPATVTEASERRGAPI